MASPAHFSSKDPMAVRLGMMMQKYRIERGLSQEEAAEIAQLTLNQWGRLERGESRGTYNSLRRVAKVMKIRISQWFAEAGY